MVVMPNTEAWVGVSPSSRDAALSCRASIRTTRLRRMTASLSMPGAPSFNCLRASSIRSPGIPGRPLRWRVSGVFCDTRVHYEARRCGVPGRWSCWTT
jgi:hypothetical protein